MATLSLTGRTASLWLSCLTTSCWPAVHPELRQGQLAIYRTSLAIMARTEGCKLLRVLAARGKQQLAPLRSLYFQALPQRSLDGVNHPDFYGNLKAAGSGGDYEICGHCTILHYSTMAL